MKKLENLKEFTIYGSGMIEIDSNGNIRVDDKDIKGMIAEACGLHPTIYDYGYITGEVKLTVTPYQHEELTVIKEEGDCKW